jgi:hypothetical protein
MDYVKYYENQSGRGLPVFRGAKIQRGYGLGNLFRSFFRWIAPILKTHALPVLKEGAKTLGTETVKAVANVATDAITGKNMENVVKDRSEEYIKSLIAKTQQGSGIKRKKKSKISQSSNKITKKKRSKKDIFDHEFLT